MKLPIILQIVFRNLLTRRLRFAFTLLAAAIAVSSTFFLFSLGYGLEKLSTEQLVKSDALLQVEAVSPKPTETKLNLDLQSRIKSLSEVSDVAVSTSLAGKLIIGNALLDSPFYAVSQNYYPLANLDLKAGRFPTGQDLSYIMVSEKTASALGKSPSELVRQKINYSLTVPPTLGTQKDPSYVYPVRENPSLSGDKTPHISNGVYEAEVIGIIANQKSSFAYISNYDASFAGADSASLVKIKARNKESVDALRKKVEDLGLKTTYVGDTLQEMNKFFSYFRLILGAFALIGILIALLGMFNTLTVSLMERVREVSLLKVLGSDDHVIFWLFALESLIFGFLGFAFGWALFFLEKAIVLWFISSLATRLGNQSANIFETPELLTGAIFLATLVITFLAGLYPARRALKVNPLDIQRFE